MNYYLMTLGCVFAAASVACLAHGEMAAGAVAGLFGGLLIVGSDDE